MYLHELGVWSAGSLRTHVVQINDGVEDSASTPVSCSKSSNPLVVGVAEVLVAKAKHGQAPLQEKCKAKEDCLGKEKENKIKELSAYVSEAVHTQSVNVLINHEDSISDIQRMQKYYII